MRAPARRRATVALATCGSLVSGLWGPALSVSLAPGCAGTAQHSEVPARRLTGEADLEQDADRPRFVVEGLTLPEPPASVDPDEPALEPLLRHARELLGRAPPQPEEDLPAAEIGPFIEGRLASWMNATAQGIRSLWEAMQGLATRTLGVHVVARALAGGTLLALAERLEAMPMPSSIRGDTALTQSIHDALANAARPMRERALQAFGACASTAVGSADPTLDEWRLHCDREAARTSARADTPRQR